jgi:hypothetical protein
MRICLLLLIAGCIVGCSAERPSHLITATMTSPAVVSSRSVASTNAFPAEAAFFADIKKRWYEQLQQTPSVTEERGKVVVEFRLYEDGRVAELNLLENEVSDQAGFLCTWAIKEASLMGPGPSETRLNVAGNSRVIRFTFTYE